MKKLTVFGISLLLVLLWTSCVSSQDIYFDYPYEVYYGEEFEITLELVDFEEDIYDVKIDILGDGTRISEILDGDEWHSTYNYVNDAIDTSEINDSIFSLNITEEYNGTAIIEVKIRGASTETFPDYEIEVLQGTPEEEEEEEENLDEDIYLDMDWDDEDIVNGKEFEIDVTAFDLKDEKYDIKVTIFKDNGDIISEIYDEEQEKWRSGSYYINEVFDGPGEETETMRLKIDSQYDDFYDYANIRVRIRETGKSTILAEESYDIEILEKDEEEEVEVEEYSEYYEEEEEYGENEEVDKGIIRLGNGKSIEAEVVDEEEKGKILYESSSEKLKNFFMYGLNIVLIFIIIFLLISFKNKKN